MFLLEDKAELTTTHRGSQGALNIQVTASVVLLQHYWVGDGILLQHMAVCRMDMIFEAVPPRSLSSPWQNKTSHGFTVDNGVQTKT